MLGPVPGHPAGDGPLVALDGAAGWALQAVVQPVAQQLPDVAAMVADPGHPLDHGRHAGQGPVVAVEAVRPGTLAQRLVDAVQLLLVKARGVPGRAGAAQRRQSALAPLGVPAADVLPGDPRVRAMSAWVWPAANGAPACTRTCSTAWRSRRPRALRR
jgi:hypothetical protein